MKQTARAGGGPTRGPSPSFYSGTPGSAGNAANVHRLGMTTNGSSALADDEVGAWLAGNDGQLGTRGPRPGGSYVIQGGESLRELCQQAYGTESATGDAFQVLVAVASGIMSPEEARAIRDTNGVVGAIANFGESWGLAPGTRLFFPAEPARLLNELAPAHMPYEQSTSIEADIRDHRTNQAIEDNAAAGVAELTKIYRAFQGDFENLATNERRSRTQYFKEGFDTATGLFSAEGKYEFEITVTREADGTWSAERSLSAGLVILIGAHHDESVKTTGAHSLTEALAQLDLAQAIVAAKSAGHDINADVLDETWTGRFGEDADLEHRSTQENLDIGLYYAEGDTKFGGKVGGETVRSRGTFKGPDGRKELGNSLEYASRAEASIEVDDAFEAKATLTGERKGSEDNPTTVKAGVGGKITPVGVSAEYEQELTGKHVGTYTITLDLAKQFGMDAVERFAYANVQQRDQTATPVVNKICDLLADNGVRVADHTMIRSAVVQAKALTSVKLKMGSDGTVELSLISDPGAISVPDSPLKVGAGEKSVSTFVINAPPKS